MSNINTVVLPYPIGSDCWWVDNETKEVHCEKGGITGFVILKDEILALDLSGERVSLHSQWCCLSEEEAMSFREQMLKDMAEMTADIKFMMDYRGEE